MLEFLIKAQGEAAEAIAALPAGELRLHTAVTTAALLRQPDPRQHSNTVAAARQATNSTATLLRLRAAFGDCCMPGRNLSLHKAGIKGTLMAQPQPHGCFWSSS
jgi:hypothetical protein